MRSFRTVAGVSLALAALVLAFSACPSSPAAAPPASPTSAPPTEAPPLDAGLARAADASPAPPVVAPSEPAKGDAGQDAAKVDTIGEAMALQARLSLVDTVVGTGREVKEGDHVTVHCVGTLADGTVFESSRAKKKPLQFVAAGDAVVVGLSQGILGMRVGGRRTLTVPPALGYGRRGKGTKVPPGATLVFDVEVLAVK